MNNGEQDNQPDKYKEIELKYKRYDVLVRGIGAFAAIASAIAGFIALRGYTGFSTATPQPFPTAPVVSPASPSTPLKASTTPPVAVASPSNPKALRSSPLKMKDDNDRIKNDSDRTDDDND